MVKVNYKERLAYTDRRYELTVGIEHLEDILSVYRRSIKKECKTVEEVERKSEYFGRLIEEVLDRYSL